MESKIRCECSCLEYGYLQELLGEMRDPEKIEQTLPEFNVVASCAQLCAAAWKACLRP